MAGKTVVISEADIPLLTQPKPTDPRFIDLEGRQCGRLKVVAYAGRINCGGRPRAEWICRCSCPSGTLVIVAGGHLRGGRSSSCGCLRRELSAAHASRLRYKHGQHETRTYRIWCGIRRRCYCSSEPAYPLYGGRGITVCERWLGENGFQNFTADMGMCPDGLTLDRVDTHGNYCKENCRWADMTTQNRNRTNTVKVTHNGVTKPLGEWAEELGVSYQTLFGRLFTLRWPVARALTEPPRRVSRTLSFNGITDTLSGWAKRLDLSLTALWHRLDSGWPIERALTEPPKPRAEEPQTLTFNGVTDTAAGWARRLDMNPGTLYDRLAKGWSVERALTEPVHPHKRRAATP